MAETSTPKAREGAGLGGAQIDAATMDLAKHRQRVLERYAEDLAGSKRKVIEQHFDPQIGLSSYARRRLIGIRAGDPDRFVKAPAKSKKAKAADGVEARADRKTTLEREAQAVAWLLGQGQRISAVVTVEAFTTLKFRGPTAVLAFERWLDTGVEPLENFIDLLPAKTFHLDTDREQVLAGAQAFIRSTTLRPVLVVEGDGLGEGLRALAGQLIKDLQGADSRPICYVPVSRDPSSGDKVSFARVVGHIAAFYRRRTVDEADIPQAAGELRMALEFIRGRMSRQPAIFILDGWAGFQGAVRRLGSLIIDDGLSSLLDEIVHPYRDPDAAQTDPVLFYQNRIIVLAATSDLADKPYVEQVLVLTPPDKGKLPEIMDQQSRPIFMIDMANAALAEAGDEDKIERTDLALSLMHFLVTQETRRGNAAAFKALFLASDDDLADLVIADLTRRPLSLFVLTVAALMPDGVRLSTLERLIDAWKTTSEEAPCESFQLSDQDEGLDNAIDRLAPLLSAGRDEGIFGLDTVENEPERRSRRSADEKRGARAYLDFVAPRLKRLFVERLIEEPKHWRAIARLHRLLAEEALAQHNIVARHGDWRDANDIRYYRRLFQALYHGFNSLELGPDDEIDLGLDALAARALPKNPVKAYWRLYAVMYRALLEAPDEWLLSRALGRDDVKVDLILMAMNIGRGSSWKALIDDSALQPRPSKFLETERRTQWDGSVAIEVDQYMSLAKAAGRNNEVAIASAAAEKGLALVKGFGGGAGESWTLDWSPALRARLSFEKIRIDIELVRRPPNAIAALLDDVKELLATFRFPSAWRTTLDQAAKAITDGGQLDVEVDRVLAVLDRDLARRADYETMSAWSDVLGLLAEINVILVEQTRRAKDTARLQQLLQAYLYLCAGDRLHRAAFELSPLTRDYYVNPHATRVMVRAQLQLVQRLRVQRPERPEERAYLANHARRQLDLLTRFVSRFPTERPSLLILESTFIRLTGPRTVENLARCETVLSEADSLMVAATHRPRVRLRLMRERAKVYAALSELHASASREAQTYMDLAELELARLLQSAKSAGLNLWIETARKQRDKLKELVAAGAPAKSAAMPDLDPPDRDARRSGQVG